MPFDLTRIGVATEPFTFRYDWEKLALYALGIGAKKDELDYLYEGRGPKAFPSFAVVPKFPSLIDALTASGGNMAMLVHGSENVTLHKAFAPSGTLTSTAKIRAIYDLRRMSIMPIDTETRDEKGELVATTTSTIIFRGEGDFGGDRPPKEPSAITIPKDRAADFRIEEGTLPEQALLYRLSGDPNPLHADPAFAAGVGFEQGPILHGLCTFGHMVRHLTKGACNGDATRIIAIDGSFKKPVWPGDTLVTEGWDVGEGRYALQVSVKERNEVVLGGAWAKLSN